MVCWITLIDPPPANPSSCVLATQNKLHVGLCCLLTCAGCVGSAGVGVITCWRCGLVRFVVLCVVPCALLCLNWAMDLGVGVCLIS